MTTIAATRDMIAADTKVEEGDSAYFAGKLYRAGDVLIGAAGDLEACQRFLEWWPVREKKRFRLPRRLDMAAIVLTPHEILVYDRSDIPDIVRDGVMAIGTGFEQARAAMDTMILLGRKPDPRIAVQVACKRNCRTGGEVEYLRMKRAKS